MTEHNEDVNVFHRDLLDDQYALLFPKPWLVEYLDGHCDCYDTEDEACRVQREWRVTHGLDPITGLSAEGAQ